MKRDYNKARPYANLWERWLKDYASGRGDLICPVNYATAKQKQTLLGGAEDYCEFVCESLFPGMMKDSGCPCHEYGCHYVARVVRKFLKAIKEGETP